MGRRQSTKTACYRSNTTKEMMDFSVARELGESRLISLDLKPVANRGLADERAGEGGAGRMKAPSMTWAT
jgi:hypothetical protein